MSTRYLATVFCLKINIIGDSLLIFLYWKWHINSMWFPVTTGNIKL